MVTQRGDADLQKLRTQIDSMPELKSALEEKGLTSAQVIAASMGAGRRADADHQEGQLTKPAGGQTLGPPASPGC